MPDSAPAQLIGREDTYRDSRYSPKPIAAAGTFPESVVSGLGSNLVNFTPEESAMLKGSADYFAL